MSWATIIWSMASAACFTLAGMQFLVWLYSREARASLLFAVAAAAVGVFAFLELELIHSQSSLVYGEILRWMHVAAAVITISMVWFIFWFMHSSRRWLAWLITILRLIILVPNFLSYPNASFAEIQSIHFVEFWGETFSTPIGESGPWRWLIHLSMLLLVIYVFDAAISCWKRGQRRRALVFGGAITVVILLSATFSGLMVKGVLPTPFLTLTFMVIMAAMAFELSMDMIHARKMARDLDESQRRMTLAARAANLGLWEWDIVSDNVWITETRDDRLGIGDGRRMRLDDYLQLVHPDDKGTIMQAIDRVVVSGGEFQVEFRLVQPDGEISWMLANGQLEYDNDGKPLLLRGVSRDITERKQAEIELQQHRRDLAHASRVSSLGQLSSSLAHEINQPLGAILRNAEAAELFLRQTPPDIEELRAILADIRMDEQRAASVIERMRALLKRRELQLETLAVDVLVAQVANLLRTEIQSRSVNLKIDMPDDLPDILGDRVHLQQVIINLLLNSLDALNDTRKEQRQIVISASQISPVMVELAVVDDGSGFTIEQLSNLFLPFHTTKKHGTGIGLAISKTIIEMHGGEITAANNTDSGATVRFTLKIALADAEQA